MYLTQDLKLLHPGHLPSLLPTLQVGGKVGGRLTRSSAGWMSKVSPPGQDQASPDGQMSLAGDPSGGQCPASHSLGLVGLGSGHPERHSHTQATRLPPVKGSAVEPLEAPRRQLLDRSPSRG